MKKIAKRKLCQNLSKNLQFLLKEYKKKNNNKETNDDVIANECEIPPSSFSDYKNGKSLPSLSRLIRIATFFGIRSCEFMTSNLTIFKKMYKSEKTIPIHYENYRYYDAIYKKYLGKFYIYYPTKNGSIHKSMLFIKSSRNNSYKTQLHTTLCGNSFYNGNIGINYYFTYINMKNKTNNRIALILNNTITEYKNTSNYNGGIGTIIFKNRETLKSNYVFICKNEHINAEHLYNILSIEENLNPDLYHFRNKIFKNF